jgi:hypothetical protein
MSEPSLLTTELKKKNQPVPKPQLQPVKEVDFDLLLKWKTRWILANVLFSLCLLVFLHEWTWTQSHQRYQPHLDIVAESIRLTILVLSVVLFWQFYDRASFLITADSDRERQRRLAKLEDMRKQAKKKYMQSVLLERQKRKESKRQMPTDKMRSLGEKPRDYTAGFSLQGANGVIIRKLSPTVTPAFDLLGSDPPPSPSLHAQKYNERELTLLSGADERNRCQDQDDNRVSAYLSQAFASAARERLASEAEHSERSRILDPTLALDDSMLEVCQSIVIVFFYSIAVGGPAPLVGKWPCARTHGV